MSAKPMLVAKPSHKVEQMPQREPFTFLQRVALHRGDPRSMICSSIGATFAFYFLWTHDWFLALGSVILSAVAGRLISIDLDEAMFAETILGKIMLLHVHPANLAIQGVGAMYLVYAVWIHSAMAIMIASSIVLVGHLCGWNKVHKAL